MFCTLRKSNPRQMLGRHLCYHYTKGARLLVDPLLNVKNHYALLSAMTKEPKKQKNVLHPAEIESTANAWKAFMLPLHQGCTFDCTTVAECWWLIKV
eukprot:scaffold102168_cov24-Attheya_sp.AAC.1